MEFSILTHRERAAGNLMNFFWLKKHEWSKWEHVMFVEDFRAGIKNYDILRRECKLTGLVQYKSVPVKDCVHQLTERLNHWWSSKSGK